jgi:hypothetical protein
VENKAYLYTLPSTTPSANVASRPKVLQNNSKPAVEKNDWPEIFGGHKAANFGFVRPKTGQKKYFKEDMFFPIEY